MNSASKSEIENRGNKTKQNQTNQMYFNALTLHSSRFVSFRLNPSVTNKSGHLLTLEQITVKSFLLSKLDRKRWI